MQVSLLNFLRQYVSGTKLKLFDQLIHMRTRYVTVVLEDIYQPHNASAVLRSCECFGLQDVHIVENKYHWKHSPDVDRGSSKWLNINRHYGQSNNTRDCLSELKAKGFQIVATTPHATMSIDELPLGKPVALVFGTERLGVSGDVINMCDAEVKIPMYGFTGSFNVSVAAAICLHTMRRRLTDSEINWHLSPSDEEEIMLTWCKRSLKHYDRYIREYNRLMGIKDADEQAL
jgi:tRNA (guanosine-2'-O-)-methyltransferase